ncbi:hypothetical protein C1H46_008459 [Malus baccata]|uniref:Retrotransposon Copia-like N-terminal domain-containing protein n=1 Tax=Malus baccata TaxID=106549 RepID=A0A540N4H2_MALBA|nr:hypothetical protein C1H46_008459 [Malus baccata]
MVTANQLQILQSPITRLISSVSTWVTVKLDDTNYLQWHFQMKLMLEGYGIKDFMDGTNPCPWQFLDNSRVTSTGSESKIEHRLMVRLQEQFSTVSKTSIFQLKSDLQTIKKGTNSITICLQQIKEARYYHVAAGVTFVDKDIVILALNGLPT